MIETNDEQTLSVRELQQIFDQIKEYIPAEMEARVESIYQEIMNQAPSIIEQRSHKVDEWRQRLSTRWRRGFDLYILIQILADVIVNKLKEKRSTDSNKRFTAIYGLFFRACVIATEVRVLMENGFPSGALARWRSLYEIGVISWLISESDESLAEKYIEHEYAELNKLNDAFSSAYGKGLLSTASEQVVKEKVIELRTKYGKGFMDDYGWASSAIQSNGNSKRKITFHDILESSELDKQMYADYKFACQSIHSAPSGFTQLARQIINSDASIHGLANREFYIPATNSLRSLLQCCLALHRVCDPDGKDMLYQRLMLRFIKECGNEFYEKEISEKSNAT